MALLWVLYCWVLLKQKKANQLYQQKIKINQMTFNELIQSEKPVLVDFFATWCGPCKTMAPILKDVKLEIGDTASIFKVDVDKNPETASAYQVQGVPTLILFQKGNILWRQSGVVPKRGLVSVIKQYIR